MKVLTTLWGLIVDDGRLASILIICLVLSWVLSLFGQSLIAAFVVWAGLLISLWISIDHQVKLKLSKEKN